MSDSIDCFCLIGGRGEFGRGAAWLTRSIRKFHPQTPIYVGIPTSETQSVTLRPSIELVPVKFPIREYPFSIQAALLKWVESNTDHNTIAMIDSDALFVNKFEFRDRGRGIYIKPEGMIMHRYLNSGKFWRGCYDAVSLKPPSFREETTVTHRTCWPFYQAGIYVVSGLQIADRLIEYTRAIWDHTERGDYFSEQIALSMLATELDQHRLPEAQNYPTDIRLYTPRSAQVIHYGSPERLLKAWTHGRLIAEVGALDHITAEYPGLALPKRFLWDLKCMAVNRARWRYLGDYGWE